MAGVSQLLDILWCAYGNTYSTKTANTHSFSLKHKHTHSSYHTLAYTHTFSSVTRHQLRKSIPCNRASIPSISLCVFRVRNWLAPSLWKTLSSQCILSVREHITHSISQVVRRFFFLLLINQSNFGMCSSVFKEWTTPHSIRIHKHQISVWYSFESSVLFSYCVYIFYVWFEFKVHPVSLSIEFLSTLYYRYVITAFPISIDGIQATHSHVPQTAFLSVKSILNTFYIFCSCNKWYVWCFEYGRISKESINGPLNICTISKWTD